MTALRMLAFRPAEAGATTVESQTVAPSRGPDAARAALDTAASRPSPRPLPAAAMENPAAPTRTPPPVQAAAPARPAPAIIEVPASVAAPAAAPMVDIDNDRWLELVAQSGLRGPARELAAHAAFTGYADGVLRLSLSAEDDHLRSPSLAKALTDALCVQLGGTVQLKFETGKPANAETLHQRVERQRDAKQTAAEENFMAHPDVQRLMSQQGAKLVPDSIRPFED